MMKRLLLLVALLLGLSLSAFAQTQSKLPLCPPVDYSKNTNLVRIAKWHICFGKYFHELNDGIKGDVIEGEFKDGKHYL